GDDGAAGIPARLLRRLHRRLHGDLRPGRARCDLAQHRCVLRPGGQCQGDPGLLGAGAGAPARSALNARPGVSAGLVHPYPTMLALARPPLLRLSLRTSSCQRDPHIAARSYSTMTARPRIAHFAGSNATILNTPPLVTSNKARRKYGLPLVTNPDGTPGRFDVLRPQRLAAPAKVYVEQFSAHPLERDAAELYGPPDGYLDAHGRFHKERQSPADKAVYEIELRPEDGPYPLPYMARQADLGAWEEECAEPGAPAHRARQVFHPDGARIFEE